MVGCDVEVADAAAKPEPLDVACFETADTPGEKIRTGMVFAPVTALISAMEPLVSEACRVEASAPHQGAPRLLELGAGVGLVGLWCAAKGVQVVLSDRSLSALELLRRNAHIANERHLGVAVRDLSWGEPLAGWLDGSFDFVVASEALYEANVALAFFATAAAALRVGGKLLVAHTNNPTVDLSRDVAPAAVAHGFRVEGRAIDLQIMEQVMVFCKAEWPSTSLPAPVPWLDSELCLAALAEDASSASSLTSDEVSMIAMQSASAECVCAMRQVCRLWRQAADNDGVWASLADDFWLAPLAHVPSARSAVLALESGIRNVSRRQQRFCLLIEQDGKLHVPRALSEAACEEACRLRLRLAPFRLLALFGGSATPVCTVSVCAVRQRYATQRQLDASLDASLDVSDSSEEGGANAPPPTTGEPNSTALASRTTTTRDTQTSRDVPTRSALFREDARAGRPLEAFGVGRMFEEEMDEADAIMTWEAASSPGPGLLVHGEDQLQAHQCFWWDVPHCASRGGVERCAEGGGGAADEWVPPALRNRTGGQGAASVTPSDDEARLEAVGGSEPPIWCRAPSSGIAGAAPSSPWIALCGCTISCIKHGANGQSWLPIQTLTSDDGESGLCLVAIHQMVTVDACETHPRQREIQREVVDLEFMPTPSTR